jgi:flagellar protein FlaJ
VSDDHTLTHLIEQAEERVEPSDDRAGESEYSEAALWEDYGPVAGYVRANPERFARLERWLKQARFGTPVDQYVRRSVRQAGYVAVGGLLVGLLAVVALADSLTVPELLLSAIALPVLGASVTAGGFLAARYGYPRLIARQRERHIDLLLPHTVVFLYALSHGGMDLYEVLERVADAEAVYGEVAAEFGLVVREMTRFDQDLFGALSTVKGVTPSEELRTFLDELESVLETGGDVDAFLHDEARRHRELAEKHQEQLLEDLGTMAEVYVSVVFAGPVFLMVVLLVASFVVPGLLFPMQLLVYLGLPLAVLWFAITIDYLLEPYRQHTGYGDDEPLADRLRSAARAARETVRDVGGRTPTAPTTGGAAGDAVADRREQYRQARRQSALERARDAPIETMRDAPVTTLAVTVPLGALAVLLLSLGGTFDGGLLASHPVRQTTTLFVVPFLIAAAPFAYFHHQRRDYSRALRRRLPAALDIVADADSNEVPLSEAFSLVARRMTGPLHTELQRIDRDLRWCDDMTGALRRFADRTTVPAVTRVSHLLRESIRATNDLAPVLRVVSEDLAARNDVRERQRRNMRPYVLVVFIGVFVYLGIVVLFDTHFLPVTTQVAERSAGALSSSPLQIGQVKTETYRRLFFHSALIQAVGNGLLLGVLVDNRVASGVGYAATLVAVELGVFLVFV